VKSRFQNLPFKCDLQRYSGGDAAAFFSRRSGFGRGAKNNEDGTGSELEAAKATAAAALGKDSEGKRIISGLSEVGLYKLKEVYFFPSLESAWFQPLNLSSEKLISKFALEWVNLYRYSEEALKPAPHRVMAWEQRRRPRDNTCGGGLYKLKSSCDP
jgi:hypothetical protein